MVKQTMLMTGAQDGNKDASTTRGLGHRNEKNKCFLSLCPVVSSKIMVSRAGGKCVGVQLGSNPLWVTGELSGTA